MEFALSNKLSKQIIQAFLMLFWAALLISTDSYYIPYLIITVISSICFWKNKNVEINIKNREKFFIAICAGIFSLMVVCANYPLWLTVGTFSNILLKLVYRLILFVLFYGGGFLVAWHILFVSAIELKDFSWELIKPKRHAPLKWFFISFFAIVFVNCSVLFLCKYPGILTYDSMDQVFQAFSCEYSNHHPFYHTMVIKICLFLGLKLFGNQNTAVALYSVLQICFMAFCFSMVSFTSSEIGVSNKIIAIVFLFYLLMPYNIMYGFTMWKDVMFGGFVLLLAIFTFRFIHRIGMYPWVDLFAMLISGIGMCLFRSNGFFAFAIFFALSCLLFFKKQKKMLFCMLAIIIISFGMKNIVLKQIDVPQPDTVEHLSIPVQQIARVIVEKDDFSNDERYLIDKIINTDDVKEKYQPWLSDNVKVLVREKGNQHLLTDKKSDFIKLYFKIGLKHPIIYSKAWIDQTKGYWNGGYDYWRWLDGVSEKISEYNEKLINLNNANRKFPNKMNIYRIEKSKIFARCFNEYLNTFEENQFLVIFLCIGFHIWIFLFIAFLSVIRKDKITFILSVPVLAIVLSLLIATPVYSEFRYIYAAFCVLPFLVVAAFYKKGAEKNNKIAGDLKEEVVENG